MNNHNIEWRAVLALVVLSVAAGLVAVQIAAVLG